MAKKFQASGERIDMHQAVTDQIIALLEKGVRPWSKSWGGSALTRPLRVSGEPYRGINVMILWLAAMETEYRSQYWMTFNQAKAFGANVRKGEHGTRIVFYTTAKKVDRETGDEQPIPVLRSFVVFNADQIDGLPEKFQPPAEVPTVEKIARMPDVDAFFAALKVDLRHGGNSAHYVVSQDYVQMPAFESFHTAESYYTTLGHETIHWTRHEKRLDRSFDQQRWGDEGYAAEELVAELGAAYLAADLELISHPREDHASYIEHWLKVLKNDKKAIFTAATHAEKAVKYLHGLVNPTAEAAVADDSFEAA